MAVLSALDVDYKESPLNSSTFILRVTTKRILSMVDEQTSKLLEVLKSYNIIETHDEIKRNCEVLVKLEALFKQWIRDVYSREIAANTATRLGGKIIPFGPYCLKAHHRGSEIDVLCVAPRYIEEVEFFESFFELLKVQPEANHCSCVVLHDCDSAIKINFAGTKLNLTFLRLSLKEVPEEFELRDDNSEITWYLGSKHSLNCCLATNEIRKQVLNYTFQVALNAILLWAKKHGIYSSYLGYFDGTTWAVLVARTCQLYPRSSAAVIVEKFFLTFLLWHWPEPVELTDIYRANTRPNHLMPVMAPAVHQPNLAPNVSQMTKKIMLAELKLGVDTTDGIVSGRLPWDHLFKIPNFLSRYRQYVVISVESEAAEGHIDWCNLVETKMHLLTRILERNPFIKLVHANSNSSRYKQGYSEEYQRYSAAALRLLTSPFSTIWYIGLSTVISSKNCLNLKESMNCFRELVLLHGRDTLQVGTIFEVHHVKL